MLNITIKPLGKWPGEETAEPKRSPFKATYKKTLEQLEFELEKINADSGSLTLEMRISQQQLTLDGSRLRAHVKPERPGVVLTFNRHITKCVKTPEGNNNWVTSAQTLSYPCDAFDDWQDNLRAITLSLESLRRVERYGVFKYDDIVNRLALPEGNPLATVDAAADYLAQHSVVPKVEILASPAAMQRA
jgi:hypothetical protein